MANSLRNKFLIIGAGYIGSYLSSYLRRNAEVDLIDTEEVDITDLESVMAAIKKYQPTHIINTAGMTNTHEIEKMANRAAAYRVNVQGPANLAYAAKSLGFFLVHLSTGMMFDGPETDTPKPISYYTWTKAWADWQLKPMSADTGILITRIHFPISAVPHPKNLLQKLMNFTSYTTNQSSMTVLEDYVVALDELLSKRAKGIYNIVNPGTASPFDIAEMLQQNGFIGKDAELVATTAADLNKTIAANGGAHQTNPILSTKKLEDLGIQLRPLRQALKESIEALAKERTA